jgi:phytoene synthase
MRARLTIACQADQDPLAAAANVTKASKSNLNAVGRFLPPAKRRLFEACYASMRVVDDFVDDDFLGRESAIRADSRAQARGVVDAWRARCEAALAGDPWREIEAGSVDQDPLIQAGMAPLYDALAQAGANGAPGPMPWTLLARSMARDIDEVPISSWDDFLHYCEGATVSPAAIFLFVLLAREEGGRLTTRMDEAALFDHARPMALFCYLVHILRDLAKDAARGGQLVTLPSDRLAHYGLARDGIAEAARAESPGALALAQEIADMAGYYRAETVRVQASLAKDLKLRERSILGALVGVYERLHDRLAVTPEAALRADPAVAQGVKQAVFDEFDLARWQSDEGEEA